MPFVTPLLRSGSMLALIAAATPAIGQSNHVNQPAVQDQEEPQVERRSSAQTSQDQPPPALTTEPDLGASNFVKAAPNNQSGDIVVTGIRRSLQTAQQIKKNADQIVDSIVAEDIGKLPDNNASEAIARVTGVQVNRSGDEANGVLIRGLPNIETTVQGREIFTADGRSVAVQDFPADSLAALEVFKANTAVNIEGGIAGLINVRLRRPFDLPDGLTVAGGGRVIYYDQSKKFDPQGNVLLSYRRDTGIGKVGILLNGSYTSADYLTSVRYDGFRNTPDASNTVAPAAAGRSFTFPQDIGIFYNRGFRYRPSANGSIQWSPNSDLNFYADGLYQGYRGRGQDDFLGLPIRGGGRSLNDVVVDPESGEAKSLTTVLVGANGPSKNTSNVNTNTYQGAVGGTWTTGPATLSADIAYTKSTVRGSTVNFDTKFAQPVNLDVDFNVGYGVQFNLPGFDQYDPANYYFRGLYQQRTYTQGKSWQGRFDGKLDTEIGLLPEFDWGFRYSNRTAYALFGDRYAGQGGLNIPLADVPGFNGGAIIPAGFRGSDIQPFRDWVQITREDLRGSVPQLLDFVRANGATNFAGDQPAFDPVRRFDAKEKVYAAYGQVKYLIDVGFPIDGVVGARLVNTDNRLAGTSRVTIAGVTSLQPVGGRNNYLDVLPNASLRARFTNKLQFRLSYTKTLTRPGFSQTNPSLVINQSTEGGNTGFTGSSGNADLQPIRSTNYDASLEWYYATSGSLTAAVFKRDINGFINTYRNVGVIDPVFGPIDVFRPENAGTGTIKGVEAAFQGFATFLPGAFSGFGVQLNATYIDGKQQLPVSLGVAGASGLIPGVSKWTYNAIGIYEKGPFSARLAYNRRSQFVTNYSAGGAAGFAAEYTKAISRLDFSGSITPVEWLTITADATNLLGNPFENFFRDQIYPRDVRYEARTYSLGLRFRF